MIRSFRSILFVPLLLALLPVDAQATTVVKISLETMTLNSDMVVYGKVLSVDAVAVNGNERHIRTDVVIQVDQLLKGRKGTRQVKLELPGGKLGRWATAIPGMPGFKRGERVVLFLEKTAVNWALTGMAQGKYTVFKDGKGQHMVRRRLDGLHFMGYDEQGRLTPVQAPTSGPTQSLNALLAEIRTTLKSAKAATQTK